MNRYGVGRPLVGRMRPYSITAGCQAELTLWARSLEEAETQFYEYAGQVEDGFPELVLQLGELAEEEHLF